MKINLLAGLLAIPIGWKIWSRPAGIFASNDSGGILWVGPSGEREWYLHGLRHRMDGPAIEWADGRREWWTRGVRHRDDGPAVEYPDGKVEWWLDGKLKKPNKKLNRS